ncbi:MAG: hypothetical protein OXI27_07810 [Thaumarchaeota archaeon]|nr:hypothetical protein [Nitrososphaerota archaeon]
MSEEPAECHIPLESFEDLARLACSYQAHPRRIFSFVRGGGGGDDSGGEGGSDNNGSNSDDDDGGTRVAATALNLANTLVVMYAPLPKDGRYVSYVIDGGRERADVVDAASNAASYAPIIHVNSEPCLTHMEVGPAADDIPDAFHPIELADLGSLARLTYDPDFPDEPDPVIYAVPVGGLWALGYAVAYDMEESHYVFYHVMLDAKPDKPFLRYGHDRAQEPELSDRIEHGHVYMPIVTVRDPHPIFGFAAHSR